MSAGRRDFVADVYIYIFSRQIFVPAALLHFGNDVDALWTKSVHITVRVFRVNIPKKNVHT